jgi:hypothetical protein
MRITTLLFTSLVFFAVNTVAQSMIPNYTTYNNVTNGTTGAVITQTISGYTQCSPTCPVGGVHKPSIGYKVKNVNTGAIEQNQTVALGSYAPNFNMNVSVTINIAFNDPCLATGDVCEVDTTPLVFCTAIANNIFNGGTPVLSITSKVATYALQTVNGDGSVTFRLQCPAGTTSTCGAAILTGSQPTLWAEEYSLVFERGGVNHCLPFYLIQYFNGPPAPLPCT